MIWANLIHLSYNMWEDYLADEYKDDNLRLTTCKEAREWAHGYRDTLTFDELTWNTLLNEMASQGLNMVIIDLGDGVLYDSHPEIAVKNAWTPQKLRLELSKMRKLGLEPIPKLNFSTGHDVWLKDYSRMVSTKQYYEVCRDIISEVIDLFDTPRFFHLGMDEETARHQSKFEHVLIRQNNLWWEDFYFYLNEVEKNNVRAWIWSDYAWNHPDVFFRKMPKSVLQSNWYYNEGFNPDELDERTKIYVKLFNDLDAHGYDQVPTGSNHYSKINMKGVVDYCIKNVNPDRLYGFMNTAWRPVLSACLETQVEAIHQLAYSAKALKNQK